MTPKVVCGSQCSHVLRQTLFVSCSINPDASSRHEELVCAGTLTPVECAFAVFQHSGTCQSAGMWKACVVS